MIDAEDYILKILEDERKKAYIQGFKGFAMVLKNQAFLSDKVKESIAFYLEESLEILEKEDYWC